MPRTEKSTGCTFTKKFFLIKSVNGQNNHVGKIYGEKIIENVFVLKQNTVVCFYGFFFFT